MKKEMQILVTGGAGYLGSVLSQYLLGRGYKVKVFDNLLFGPNSLKHLLDNPQYEFVKGDICDSKLLGKELDGIDTVIHLAAIVGDVECNEIPRVSVEVNQEASIRLIDQCIEKGKKFVLASTASNYGVCPEKIASEECNLNPVSLYAKTKIAVEQYLKGLDAADFDYTILRFGTAYGLSPRMRSSLLIHFLIKEIVSKGKVSIYGPELCRPYVHNTDIARAIELVINSPAKNVSGEIFNVVGENFSKAELLELLKEFLDFKIEIFEKLEDLRNYRISGEKIRKRLGFKAKRTVREELPVLIQAAKLGVF